ncbi:UV DNA damage repair endonuclease UvsE [Deinococcus sp.]|uniref:UV DNA damage repair endonuclease UvsE n=1 Tax=Deinococcus sp. TaxID=47478 RepID=UPI00286D6EA5|nr:UV DNA damage repair endonuclease UvsE [Deinococcus sp.]
MSTPPALRVPNLGLVCITSGPEVRFRTITRTRYLSFPEDQRRAVLHELYADNVSRLVAAAAYCASHGIRLYRLSAALFPMLDLEGDVTGQQVLESLAADLRAAGDAFTAAGIRVLVHPDQFIVLNSESSDVVRRAVYALSFHGLVMDMLGFSRTPWNTILLHGGKGGRPAELTGTIAALPDAVRLRLALENDERAYGPAELLPVCHAAGVPLIFDAHHHVVRGKLDSQDDPSVREWVLAARATWTPPGWQVVHLSNGINGPQDRRHTDLITHFPQAYRDVPWIEVEAKGKELALAELEQLME